MTAAVLFDLDCTLTDRPATVRRFADRFVAAFGGRVGGGGTEVAAVVTAADRCGYAPRTAVAAALASRLPWCQAPEPGELLAFWHSTFPDLAVARSGAADVLADLRAAGVRTGLVSNGAGTTQRRKLAATGLAASFDTVVISGEVGLRKPDAAIFLLATRRLGVAAGDAWFVGDHPLLDVDGPRRAGLTAAWLAGAHPWPDALLRPPHVLLTLSELRPLVGAAGDSSDEDRPCTDTAT